MVFSAGSVKMAVMARLSDMGNFLQPVTDAERKIKIEIREHLSISDQSAKKAGHHKLVAQYIQKELLEADDANLLDEEDMHVFGLNPVTDPLHLVRCNFCRKPVKATHFVIHAELCRSLGIADELLSELDSVTVNRKPPRKERKKSVTTGKRITSNGGRERFATVDGFETAVSSSQLNEGVGITFSSYVEAQGTLAGSAGDMDPLTKRPKLIAADTEQPSDEIQTARGVNNIINFHDAITYDVPTPLAAKTYYSQRNNRLQAALSHMFHQASTKQCCTNQREWQGNLIVPEASSPGMLSEEQLDDQLKKMYTSHL